MAFVLGDILIGDYILAGSGEPDSGPIILYGAADIVIEATVSATANATVNGLGELAIEGQGAITASGTVTGSADLEASGSGSITATATVAGQGELEASGVGLVSGSVTVNGLGELACDGEGAATAAVSVASLAELSVESQGTVSGSVYLNGLGELAVESQSSLTSAATVSGVADLAIEGQGTSSATAVISGSADLACDGAGTVSASATTQGTGELELSGGQIIITVQGLGEMAVSSTGATSGSVDIDGLCDLLIYGPPDPDPITDFETDLGSYLRANIAGVGNRVYSLTRPQTTAYPALVYQVIGEENDYHLLGDGNSIRPTVELTVYAKDKETLETLGQALRGALCGQIGLMGLGSYVMACQLENSFEGYEPPKAGQGFGVLSLHLQYSFHYSERFEGAALAPRSIEQSTFSTDLHQSLLEHLGPVMGNQVYWLARPQGTALPACTYQLLGSGHDYCLAGASGSCRKLVSVSFWSSDPADCRQAHKALKRAWTGLGFEMGETQVMACVQENKVTLVDAPKDGKGCGVFRIVADFSMHVRESVPVS